MINNKILGVIFISLFIVLGNQVASGSANAVRSELLDSQTIEISCTDSDGGINYEIAGTVTGIGPNGYPYSKADVCETGDYEGSLKEYFCNGSLQSARRYACPIGCQAGACVTSTPTCTDADGDTYAVEGGTCGLVDCDDTNPLVNPGAAEICDNGIDDDCNGLIDSEDSACIVCTDADADTYAVDGGACGLVDCDDTNPLVNPGAAEVCDNGIDDNCNGLTDSDDEACKASPTSSDAIQNKAFAHLEIDSLNVAHITAGFTHPDDLNADVMIEWFLYGWNDGADSRNTIRRYVRVTGAYHVEVDVSQTVPVYDYYLLESKNKIRNTDGNWISLFSSESRWGRNAPHNGIWERTGEVTSDSAVLHTYLSEKPAFNATEADNLRVPPMAGHVQFVVYADAALQDKVTESGFYPVDDYILVGAEWRRTNYNFRWTVAGLSPDTSYFYIVETKSSDGLKTRMASNVNSFRTAPLKDAEDPTVFVVAHCFDVYNTAYPDEPAYEDLGLKVFASMLTDPPPDFVILQGDTVYYDGGAGYSPDVGPYYGYNMRWLYWYAQYQFTNFMNFFQQVPGYWMVDDHDYWANNINQYMPDGWYIFRNANPTPGDYGTTGENAVNYYNNPDLTSAGNGEKYWRSIRWGKHLEIFIEEGHNYRDYDAGFIWGTEQREWLEQQILASDATFKIIAATTPLLGPVVPDSTYPSVIPDKHASNHFRTETELFLNNIREVENVIILAGDRHYKYHSIINSDNFPELSNFQEFSSGAAAGPPHAIYGGVPDSDLAKMIYSDAELEPSAGYMHVEIVPGQDGVEITIKLIRVTVGLDNEVVHEHTYFVQYGEP